MMMTFNLFTTILKDRFIPTYPYSTFQFVHSKVRVMFVKYNTQKQIETKTTKAIYKLKKQHD